MKQISTLAENFRKQSSAEAQSISKDLESGLKQLESATATALKSSELSLLEALSSSEKTMRAAIKRNQRAQLMALRWPMILLLILSLALTAWSSWQGYQINEQTKLIAQSKRTLSDLPAGWKVIQNEGKTYLATEGKKPSVMTSGENKWFIPIKED